MRKQLNSIVLSEPISTSGGVPCTRLVVIVSMLTLGMTVAATTVSADEQKTGQQEQSAPATTPDTAKAPAEAAASLPVPVDLQDGAASSQAALTAYVAASSVGDEEAALLMVDPPIRHLLIPEMAIERHAFQSTIIERAMFGKREVEFGGMLFYCAGRDLVRVRSIKQLDSRVVDDDRVVVTVLTTEQSYHGLGDINIVRQYLTIRRSGRWYLFRPFGLITQWLREPLPLTEQDELPPLIGLKRNSEKTPNREDAIFEIEYMVPIEVIHEHLVLMAHDPAIEECQQVAEKLNRYYASVVNRTIRGDYPERAELLKALTPISAWTNELNEKWGLVLQSGIQALAKRTQQQRNATNGKPNKE